MSGGVAYVLDETGEFSSTWCNRTGVDLDELDSKDMEAIRNLIERHVEYTGSPRGQWVLENWSDMLPKFVKVFPHEFKRVMGVARTQQAVKTMAVKGSETTQEVRA
jgi:glutamate synthase domain-containing protein 3